MATDWYYSRDGVRHGPVSGRGLADLAASGRIGPADLVWKDGMPAWVPAGKVKGLFPATVAPPAVPAPPTAPSPIAAAAEGLFATAIDTAKRVGSKVVQAAREAQETGDNGETAAPVPNSPVGSPTTPNSPAAPPAPPKLSRRTLIVAGVAGGALLLSCVVCGLIGVLVSRGNRPRPESATGDSGELRAFADVPPPVQEAVNGGRVSWEITGWNYESDSYLKRSLYVVLDNGSLSALHSKAHHKKGSVFMGDKGKDKEVIEWGKLSIDLLPTEKSKMEWHWRWEPAGENRYTLTYETRLDVNGVASTRRMVVSIVIDPQVGEGYWHGEEHLHEQYKGRLAKYDDKKETKPLSGGSVLPVKPK